MNHLHVARRCSPLMRLVLVLTLACVGLQDADAYEVEYTNIDVCNTGNVKFYVGVVKADLNFFSADYRVDGWYGVKPGKCQDVDYRDQPGTYYLSFMQYDANGNPAIAIYRPGQVNGIFKNSDRSFCVKLDPFGYEESGRPTQDCPSPYFLAPFPFSIWRVPGQNDLQINIEASSSARLVAIPGSTQQRSSSKPEVTQAPPTAPTAQATPPKSMSVDRIGIVVEEGVDLIYVKTVADNSQAMKAGVLEKDVIYGISVNRSVICAPDTLDKLRPCLERVASEPSFFLVVKRDKKVEVLQIHQSPSAQQETTQVIPPPSPAPSAPTLPPPPPKAEWLGIRVMDHGRLHGNPSGLQIVSVTDGSPAMKTGVLKGDIIGKLSDLFNPCTPQSIQELRDCLKVVSSDGVGFLLDVYRDGKRSTLYIKPEVKPVVYKEPSSAMGEAF